MEVRVRVLLLISVIFASSCGGKPLLCDGLSGKEDTATAQAQCNLQKSLSLRLDTELDPDEKSALLEDLTSLVTAFDPSSAPLDSPFAQIFQGTKSSDVIRYMNDRVQYIIGRRAVISDRVRIRTASMMGPLLGSLLPAAADTPPRSYVVAANLGTVIWLQQELERPSTLYFRFSDQDIPIVSSRIGIIQISDGYTHAGLPSIHRTATLVHEARHSDCTGGISSLDLDTLRRQHEPSNKICGHMHVKCPPEHPLAGLPACDDHPWGAYSVDAIYSSALARYCTHCTEAERTVAEASGIDSLGRVLVNRDDMLQGRLGQPDMSSSGLRAE